MPPRRPLQDAAEVVVEGVLVLAGTDFADKDRVVEAEEEEEGRRRLVLVLVDVAAANDNDDDEVLLLVSG